MFTGLIEEIGIVKSVKPLGKGLRIAVSGKRVMDDLKIDDSIALDGVCQTVVAVNSDFFEVDTIEQSLSKTTLNKIKPGRKLNLERAVQLSSRMGGHLVQGHVDCTGKVSSIEQASLERNITISFPGEFAKYIVPVGSICVNGVSLTASSVSGNSFTVSIIPHSLKMTTLNDLSTGSSVNLEFDIIGKYIEKMLSEGIKPVKEKKNSILDQYIDQPF